MTKKRRREKKRKEHKEAGKVIVKKKARVRPSVTKGRRVRWDLVFAAVVIALIGFGIWYAVAHATRSNHELTPATENLYKALNEIYFSNKPNPNVTLDVFYGINGSVPVGNVTYGVNDIIQFRIFFYNRTISLSGSMNASKKELVVTGHAVLAIGANYIHPILKVLGFTNSLNNVSQLIINTQYLRKHHVRIISHYLGVDYVRIPTVKKPVKTVKVSYEYTVNISKKTYHVKAVVWYEVKYKFPVKALISVNGYTFELRLEYAQLTHFMFKRI